MKEELAEKPENTNLHGHTVTRLVVPLISYLWKETAKKIGHSFERSEKTRTLK